MKKTIAFLLFMSYRITSKENIQKRTRVFHQVWNALFYINRKKLSYESVKVYAFPVI